jgi:hypothetical protein
MTATRYIPLALHGALEAFAAPAIMAAPFALGLGVEATAIAVVLGAILMGHALSLYGERPMIPLGAHAGFDYVLAVAALLSGVGVGLATGEAAATVFLVGVGVAQMALTASTRFSVSRGL